MAGWSDDEGNKNMQKGGEVMSGDPLTIIMLAEIAQLKSERDALKNQNNAYATLAKSQESRLVEYGVQNAKWLDAVATLDSEKEANTILTQERDALAMHNQQMREALTLWKIASDNSEEVEFDEMAVYSIPMPLFCDADEATEAALVLPDNTEAIIKRHDAAVLRKVVKDWRDGGFDNAIPGWHIDNLAAAIDIELEKS